MRDLVQIGTRSEVVAVQAAKSHSEKILWIQGITLVWMLLEFVVSAYAARMAHSPAMLAFGSDSFVELLSATVVLLQWVPRASISEQKAAYAASVLLFTLAAIVATTATASFVLELRPRTSRSGMAITIAALVAMPILASLKRREAQRDGNAALAADAVQSATCAYMAGITLAGLSMNALFHLAWFDSAAALLAVPILLKEGWSIWHGQKCGCS